jgi:hypothetical protein
MIQQIEQARFVLLVCTENYYQRVMMRAESGTGLGALWEGHLIHQRLANAVGNKAVFRLTVQRSSTITPFPC